jgi:leader peptidase (prepilin peptidase) / N-methyltransferase
MEHGFYFVLTLFLGLCLGSFATALAWRLPRGVSISIERSKCPGCRRALGVADLVPVFSWLFLRGRCRGCGAPIGWRYPLMELATLALCLAFHARFGFSLSTLLLYALAPVIVAMAEIDLAHKILPDALNLAVPLIGIAVLIANALESSNPADFIIGHGAAAAGGAVLYGLGALALRQGVMAILKKDPLGWGDVKFFAAAGFWLGLDAEAAAHFLLLSGIFGMVLALIWRKIRGEPEFPFGPALLAAFTALLLWHPPAFIFQ